MDECVKEMDRCVLDELSDGSAYIASQYVPEVIFDHTTEKDDPFGDGVSQRVDTITLHWLKEYMPSARSGNEVKYRGKTYRIKKGYPLDTNDCWLMA